MAAGGSRYPWKLVINWVPGASRDLRKWRLSGYVFCDRKYVFGNCPHSLQQGFLHCLRNLIKHLFDFFFNGFVVQVELREKSQSASVTILYIASIYLLLRPEVKAYFKKKRISEREEELSKKEYEKPAEEEESKELSKEEQQELTGKEYGKLTEEEKHMKEEYEQLMEED